MPNPREELDDFDITQGVQAMAQTKRIERQTDGHQNLKTQPSSWVKSIKQIFSCTAV